MLPGDYIAMKLSGDICTTVSGLSEGMFWDFKNNRIADFLMDFFTHELRIPVPLMQSNTPRRVCSIV